MKVNNNRRISNKKKMSSFLDRFVGRTQTVSKQGLDELLRGKEDNILYTNTHKSFARSSSHQRLNHPQPHPKEIQKDVNEQEEAPFHLPHLQARYMDSETRRAKEEQHLRQSNQSNSRMHIDKETNWLIEEKEIPILEQVIQNRIIASVDSKTEHSRDMKEKGKMEKERTLKSYHQPQHKSGIKLGGLGPNLGGEQWVARREKQQKMRKYAGELKRVHRERLAREKCETSSSFSANRMLGDY